MDLILTKPQPFGVGVMVVEMPGFSPGSEKAKASRYYKLS